MVEGEREAGDEALALGQGVREREGKGEVEEEALGLEEPAPPEETVGGMERVSMDVRLAASLGVGVEAFLGGVEVGWAGEAVALGEARVLREGERRGEREGEVVEENKEVEERVMPPPPPPPTPPAVPVAAGAGGEGEVEKDREEVSVPA